MSVEEQKGVPQLRIHKVILPIKDSLPANAAEDEFNLGATEDGIGFVGEDGLERTVIDTTNASEFLNKPVARTVTADGSGTGTIETGTRVVLPTSDDANKILVLPDSPVGDEIFILPETSGTGYELRTSDPATISLNNVSGAGKELAVAAATSIIARRLSATAWIATKISNVGAPTGGGTPD